ncbi:MAG: hypothetical protein J5701_00165 [Bacteroidales bacterium]|nr:hypothetical protein [Bacteroidales bacterium]
MKKLSIVAALTAIILLVSCGTMNNGTTTSSTSGISTTSAAFTSGKGFGTSLTALYNSYKSAGKLNLNDATNLLNLASLATYASAIKGNAKNTTFYKEFAAGAVASSNLITANNVASIISSVINTDINSIVNAARSGNTNTNTNTTTTTNTNNNTTAAVNTLTSVLNAMNNAK